ncbi:MAG: phage tail protein, partial [Candidatus Paceibacterota bacterium]
LDIANATQDETRVAELIAEKDAKESEIAVVESDLGILYGDLDVIDSDIDDLRIAISIENNFTNELIEERNDYIIHRTWSNDNYFDEEDLYEAAKVEFDKIRTPKTTIKTNIINFLEVLSEHRNWDKLNIGDIITIDYEMLGINVQAKITEINFNYEDYSIDIVISNISDIKNDENEWIRKLNKSYSTSTNVDMTKYKWDKSTNDINAISEMLNGAWDATKRRITAGINEAVDISERGIIVKNPEFPDHIIIIQAGVCAISADGGNTWKNALTTDGLIAERIIGKIILSENTIIGDANGIIDITGNLITISDNNQVKRVKLGEYEDGKYGLELKSKDGQTTVLDEDGILQTDTIQEADNVDGNNP